MGLQQVWCRLTWVLASTPKRATVKAPVSGRSCELRATNASCTCVPELSLPGSAPVRRSEERCRRTKGGVRLPDEAGEPAQLSPPATPLISGTKP